MEDVKTLNIKSGWIVKWIVDRVVQKLWNLEFRFLI